MSMRLAALLLVSLFASAPLHAQTAKPLTGVVICIDPGHPSETSEGTESRDHRLTERHLNWVIALKLRQRLLDDGATVVLTKSREAERVTNRHRAEIANAAHAALFLRLHCDAASESGLATFYPDRAGYAQGHVGPPLSVMAASRRAALLFHPSVIAALRGRIRDRGIKGDSQTGVGAKQGALTGSVFAQVPALTVEMCVLTNAHDYAVMRVPAGQEAMADALEEGVKNFSAGTFKARAKRGTDSL